MDFSKTERFVGYLSTSCYFLRVINEEIGKFGTSNNVFSRSPMRAAYFGLVLEYLALGIVKDYSGAESVVSAIRTESIPNVSDVKSEIIRNANNPSEINDVAIFVRNMFDDITYITNVDLIHIKEYLYGDTMDNINLIKNSVTQILSRHIQPTEKPANSAGLFINSLASKGVYIDKQNEIEKLFRNGRCDRMVNITSGKFKDFYETYQKHIKDIPEKHYSGKDKIYKLIMENFTNRLKKIPKTTISNIVNNGD